MRAKHNNTVRPRLVFMLLIAIAITCVFFWVISVFVVTLFVSAVLSGLLHPFYLRVTKWLGGRRGLAFGVKFACIPEGGEQWKGCRNPENNSGKASCGIRRVP